MNGVSSLHVVEEITLVTFSKIPSDINFVGDLLTMVSDRQINIDMISLTNTHSGFNSLSFTVLDKDLGELLEITAGIKNRYPAIKPLISSGNAKISLFGEEMRELYGVAAKAISAVSSVGTDIRLITTSEVDISLLIAEASLLDIIAVLKETFSLS